MVCCEPHAWLGCRDLRRHGGEASKASGSELIISLCKAGQCQEALKVYEDMTAPPLPPEPLPGTAGLQHFRHPLHTPPEPAGMPISATRTGESGETTSSVPGSLAPSTPQLPHAFAHKTDNTELLDHIDIGMAHEAAAAGNAATWSRPASEGGSPGHELQERVLTDNWQRPAAADLATQRSSSTDGDSLSDAPSVTLTAVESDLTVSSTVSQANSSLGSSQSPDTAVQAVGKASLGLVRPKRRGGGTPTGAVQPHQAMPASSSSDAAHSGHDRHAEALPKGEQGHAGAGAGAVGDPGGGRMELHSSTRLSQRVTFPSTAATAALVHAFAHAGDLHHCHRSAFTHGEAAFV